MMSPLALIPHACVVVAPGKSIAVKAPPSAKRFDAAPSKKLSAEIRICLYLMFAPFIRDKENGGAEVHVNPALQVQRLKFLPVTMQVCPQCSAELKAGDPAGLCPACLLAGAIGSGFTSGDSETQTITADVQEPAAGDSFGPYRILKVLGE